MPPSRLFLLRLLALLLLGLIAACQPPAPPAPDTHPLLATFTPTAAASSTATATALTVPTATPPPTATSTPLPTVTPTSPPAATPTPLPTATPRPTSTATATPAPAKLEITLTEAQLNKIVRDALASAPNPTVQEVTVDTQPGQLLLTGQTRVGFLRVGLGVIATFSVSQGRVQPTIQSVLINGQPTGGFIRQQIEAQILPYLDQLANANLGLWVEEVEISEEAMRLRGVAR